MRIRGFIMMLAVTVALAVSSLPRASATITLATFAQTSAGKPFVYHSNVNGLDDATFDIVAATAVWTPKDGVFGLPVNVPIDGVLVTMSGTAPGLVSGNVEEADITSLKFVGGPTGPAALVGKTLLEMKAIGPDSVTFGLPTGDSVTMSGTDAGGSGLTSIVYSSDLAASVLLNQNPPGYPAVPARGYGIGLSAVEPPLGIETGNTDWLGFSAQFAGDMSFTPAVPEPGALATLIGLGVTGSLFGFKLRRRRS